MSFSEIAFGLMRNPHLKACLKKSKYKSILTLGGGPCEYLKEIEADFKVSVELFRPYAEYSTQFTSLTILGDVIDYPLREDFQWDLILCTEIIEHLEKSLALALLSKIFKLSNEIFITTPASDTGPGPKTDANIFQFHKSVYSIKDLTDLGYEFKGTEHCGVDIGYVWRKQSNDVDISELPTNKFNLLRCSKDGFYPLELTIFQEKNSVVESGVIRCPKCERYFPIRNKIPEILPDVLRDFNADHSFLNDNKSKLPEAFNFNYVG